MSFSVEFVATQANAEKIVEQEHLPSEVKLFLQQALRAFIPESFVSVKAVGHLYNKDYQSSSASIDVHQLGFRTPKT